jgi:hypothetical protein
MSPQPVKSPRKLPAEWAFVGTILVSLHFFAVGMLVLSASSGPWSTPFGESPASGPKFSEKISELVTPYYLSSMGLTHNYHFTGNRPMVSAVYFEARLKDAHGNVVKTLVYGIKQNRMLTQLKDAQGNPMNAVEFPGDAGNAWLRHRYKLLALALGNDQPVQASRGEMIQAPGDKMPKVTYWDASDPKLWKLKTEDEHLIAKDRPVMRPSEWSLLMARSFQRYLLRENAAASVELIRHSRDQVLPDYMYLPNPPPNTFDELVCSFGEYRREN